MRRLPLEWLTLLALVVYWLLMRDEEANLIDLVILLVAAIWSILSLIKAVQKSKE
jgi:hypothetical protein